jgi:hypothetical protein
MYIEFARLVTRRRDDTALATTADGYRQSAQIGIIPLFNRGIERIHVDMDKRVPGSSVQPEAVMNKVQVRIFSSKI